MKKLLIVLVETNVWVSSGLALLVLPTAHLLSLPYDWRIPVLGFCVSMVVYTWDHRNDVLRGEWAPSPRVRRYYEGRRGKIVIGLAGAGALAILCVSPVQVSMGAVLLVFFGIAYGSRIIPDLRGSWFRFKDIHGSKAWFTTLLCASGAVGAPLVFRNDYSRLPWPEMGLAWMFMFVMIACNAHMYDIRDLDVDRKHGVRTLPVWLGAGRTKTLLYGISCSAAGVWSFLWIQNGALSHPEMLLWITGTFAYLWGIDTRKERLVYDVFIDGTLFLPTLALLLHHVKT